MSSDRELLHQCEVGYSNGHGSGHVKMSDLDRLAMLKSKAKQESGSFSCMDILKMFIFIGIVCSFAIVFYKIACLRRDVDTLSEHVAVLHYETQRQAASETNRATQPANRESTRLSHWDRVVDGYRNIPRSKYPAPNRDATKESEECNCTTGTPNQRSRRSASGSGQELAHSRRARDVTNGIGMHLHEYGQHFAQHLVPNKTNSTIRQGEVFTWRLPDNATPFLKEAGLELVDHSFLRAPVSGLYFVYSQITFQDSLSRTVGQQVVVVGGCGAGNARIPLGTSVTQQRQEGALGTNPRDSSYTGGVVYLSEGDHVGVRPDLRVTKMLSVTQSDENTFFGGFLISRDTKAPSIHELCPTA